MIGQLAYIEFETERIAEEAREGVHDDHIDRAIPITGALNHPLKLGALVVRRGGASLDILARHGPILLPDPSNGLCPLVGDREIVFGLPPR